VNATRLRDVAAVALGSGCRSRARHGSRRVDPERVGYALPDAARDPVRIGVLEQFAVFAAGFLTAITGFGFNALSLPLLAVAFEPHHAVVVGLQVGLLIFVLVLLLPGVRHAVDTRLVWTLFAWSLLGLPVGARILVVLDDRTLRLVIGGLTFVYAAGQLTGLVPAVRASRRATPYVGVVSGILSSSVSMGGTPIILYLIGLGGEPRDLRATAVAYVVLSTIGSLVVLWWTGLVDRSTIQDALELSPAAVAGFALGALAFRYVSRQVFLQLTHVLLAATGVVALVAGLR
jgi:uncharacterized protein